MRDITNAVRDILISYPETRDDDMKLYSIFVYRATAMGKNISFYEATYNHKRYNLPSYESVTRARRKIQESEEKLRGTKRAKRMKMEEEYREFYSRRK